MKTASRYRVENSILEPLSMWVSDLTKDWDSGLTSTPENLEKKAFDSLLSQYSPCYWILLSKCTDWNVWKENQEQMYNYGSR